MIRDWDLWPIYLSDPYIRWLDAERARQLAEMNRRLAAVIARYQASLPSLIETMTRLQRVCREAASVRPR